METFSVPCARCDEFRARFVAEGFIVLGCDPDPNKPGMCALKYERPTALKAAAAAPAGVAAASSAAGATAMNVKPEATASSSTAAAGPPRIGTAPPCRRESAEAAVHAARLILGQCAAHPATGPAGRDHR